MQLSNWNPTAYYDKAREDKDYIPFNLLHLDTISNKLLIFHIMR